MCYDNPHEEYPDPVMMEVEALVYVNGDENETTTVLLSVPERHFDDLTLDDISAMISWEQVEEAYGQDVNEYEVLEAWGTGW